MTQTPRTDAALTEIHLPEWDDRWNYKFRQMVLLARTLELETIELKRQLALREDLTGMLQLVIDQKSALLASCETALAERDRQLAEAQRDDCVMVPIQTLILMRRAITDDAPFGKRAIELYEGLKTTRRAAIQEQKI